MALGIAIGWGEEDIPNKYAIALRLFNNALKLPHARNNEKAQLYGNIALVHTLQGDAPAAIDAFETLNERFPQATAEAEATAVFRKRRRAVLIN